MGKRLIDLLPYLPKEELITWVRSFAGPFVIEHYPEWPNYDEKFYEVLKKEYAEGFQERLKEGDLSQILPGEAPWLYVTQFTNEKKKERG